jgi:hypothetical protein
VVSLSVSREVAESACPGGGLLLEGRRQGRAGYGRGSSRGGGGQTDGGRDGRRIVAVTGACPAMRPPMPAELQGNHAGGADRRPPARLLLLGCRFATLAGVLRGSLSELQRAIKGLVVMSAELEAMYHSLLNNQVGGGGGRGGELEAGGCATAWWDTAGGGERGSKRQGV